MNRKILVLGGTQFVGRNLVEALMKADIHRITLLNRGNNQIFGNKVDSIIADRKIPESCAHALKHKTFDVVYDVSGYTENDVKTILDSLKEPPKYYVYISTAAVYLPQTHYPVTENATTGKHPMWGEYGINKMKAEQYLQQRADKDGFKLIIIRPSYIYGRYNHIPRERFVFEHIVHDLPILLPGGGNAITQFGHIFDLTNLLVSLLEKSKPSGIYNVSTDEHTSLREFVATAAEICGKKPNIISVDLGNYENLRDTDVFPFANETYYTDISRAKKLLGYRSEISLRTGLKMEFKRMNFDNTPVLLPKEKELETLLSRNAQ